MLKARRCYNSKTLLNEDIQSVLLPRRQFDRLANNTVWNTKQMLLNRSIPNYIAPETKLKTLSMYRHLHRAASKQLDPLCRHFLRVFIWESFAAYRHTTSKDHIRILLRDGGEQLQLLQRAVHGRDIKATNSVMELVFKRVNVHEGPLKRILGVNRLPLTPAVLVSKLTPPKGLSTFDEYFEARSKSPGEFYFQFLSALKTGPPRLSLGYNETRIIFDPQREGTIVGTKLPASRERNIISRRMVQVLKMVKRPIDSSTLAYLELMLHNVSNKTNYSKLIKLQPKQPLRVYRRRVLDILEHVYTLDYSPDGKLMAKVPTSSRIKISALPLYIN